MSPKQRNPDTHQPITSYEEYTRTARKLAGLPEWDMDDPERPFTEEYDAPRPQDMVEQEAPLTPQKPDSVSIQESSKPEPTVAESYEARAAKIAETLLAKEAKRYNPNKEPSEAAKDQGWDPVDTRELPKRMRTNPKPKKIKPYRGKLRGESEGELSDIAAVQVKIDKTRNQQLPLDP